MNYEKRAKEIERLKALEVDQLKAIQEAQDIEKIQVDEQKKWSEIIQNKMKEFKAAENTVKKNQKLSRENTLPNIQLNIFTAF